MFKKCIDEQYKRSVVELFHCANIIYATLLFRISYTDAIDVLKKHYNGGATPKVRKKEKKEKKKRKKRKKRKKEKKEKKKKKKWVPGSHTRDGVRTHVCIRTLELKSNALTTRPPWFDEYLCCVIEPLSF